MLEYLGRLPTILNAPLDVAQKALKKATDVQVAETKLTNLQTTFEIFNIKLNIMYVHTRTNTFKDKFSNKLYYKSSKFS